MDQGGRVQDNLPVIEFLLEHGADPRLKARSKYMSPIRHAQYFLDKANSNDGSEEAKVFWGKVVALFEEAVKNLDGKLDEAEKGETALED